MMRLAGWIFAAVVVVAPMSVKAEATHNTRSAVWKDTVTLWAGERVTLRLPDSGMPQLVSIETAPEVDAAPPKPGNGRFADPPAGAVVLLLGRVGDRLVLKIESGVAKTFDYRAERVTQAAVDNLILEPVKVCSVLPLLASYESWPKDAATGLRLHAFQLRDTNDVVCPDPAPRPPPK